MDISSSINNNFTFPKYVYQNIIKYIWMHYEELNKDDGRFPHRSFDVEEASLNRFRYLLSLDLVCWQFHSIIKKFNDHLDITSMEPFDVNELEQHLSSRYCPVSDALRVLHLPTDIVFPTINQTFNARVLSYADTLADISINLYTAPFITQDRLGKLRTASVFLEKNQDDGPGLLKSFIESNRQIEHLILYFDKDRGLASMYLDILRFATHVKSITIRDRDIMFSKELGSNPGLLYDSLSTLKNLEHLDIDLLGDPDTCSPLESLGYYPCFAKFICDTKSTLRSLKYSEEMSVMSPIFIRAMIKSNIEHMTLTDGIPLQYIDPFQRKLKEMVVCIDEDICNFVVAVPNIIPLFNQVERFSLVVRDINAIITPIIASIISSNKSSKYITIRIVPKKFHIRRDSVMQTIAQSISSNDKLGFFKFQMESVFVGNTNDMVCIQNISKAIKDHPTILSKENAFSLIKIKN